MGLSINYVVTVWNWKMNKISIFLFVSLFCFMLYTSYYAIIDFYTGFHNIDTAQNFLRLGFDYDINLNGVTFSLEEFYTIGINQIMKGFKWIVFDVILSFMLGILFYRCIK